MLEHLSEKISVISVYNKEAKTSSPVYLFWSNKKLTVTKIGLHHTINEGNVLIHVFCVIAGDLFFKLHFDTKGLTWTLKELSDGNSG